jgi:hypothetical protein
MRRIHELGHFLRRVGGRIARWCGRFLRIAGTERAPVRELTEADLARIDRMYALAVSMFALGVMTTMLLLITWRPSTC